MILEIKYDYIIEYIPEPSYISSISISIKGKGFSKSK